MLKAFLYLLMFQLAGTLINTLTGIPVPGTVLGFMLLFFCLLLRPHWLGGLLPVTRPLLENMILLFVPVAVGIMQQWPLLLKEGWTLTGVLVVSQVIGFIATAMTITFLMSAQKRLRRSRQPGGSHDSGA
ncbi:CidA/LrgA family protein [Mangrovitalea sediminis]|uniref:CidA/LrgA family protein n=1 Tax=Mangrovitalea sediminis TaxID=1982043 RepID=UPI000BE51E4C|nr:CidA/LrgA family protein [Mangrovitalea sediminis]